ncbi:hypothetical protein [Streptomyces sp. JB150]|uniref:hypothetical protein n=1 Tax=Streptomyces sp. JB150 TaxID=2714844 RepID=UPI00140BABEB|nr:hypothetical protein [Streptomyces sp. JB150]QIJ65711.1 hypothetical protein G7Z13_29590 [Streptomyces sp. JB150]
MTSESAASADLEELRRAELARREQRRRARESGAVAPLHARRRARAENLSVEPVDAPSAVNPAPSLVRLPTRVTHVLERVLEELGEEPAWLEGMRTRASASGDPLGTMALETVELLRRAEPLTALGHLLDLASGGLCVLSEEDRSRAEALRSGRLPAPRTEPTSLDAWQLHLEATEAQRHGLLAAVAWQRLAERLPLPVVDDLVDQGALRREVLAQLAPGVGERTGYLTARLDPGRLSDADVEALEWHDEKRRRALAAGGTVDPVDGRHDEWSLRSALLAGDASVVDVAASHAGDLPVDLADLLLSLRRIRQGGPVDGRLGRDRSLFGLLEDCVPDGRLISGSTPFHYWAGTRRLYRLLDDIHWAMACEPDQTETVVRAALQQAAVLRNPESRGAAGNADREARAVQAYLMFLYARPGERDRLDQGVGLLEDVLKRGGKQRGGVDGRQRHRLRSLSELLQSLRLKSKPSEVLNPYLALCVEHGSTEWVQGWRDLRRQVPAERLEYINGAKDRIRRIETARRLGEAGETLYDIPLNERFLWVPDDRSPLLQPDPQPMARRTKPSTEQEKSWTAAEAAKEIIGRCAGRLRNEH